MCSSAPGRYLHFSPFRDKVNIYGCGRKTVVTTVGPASILTVGAAAHARPDASESALQAASFEHALAQAPTTFPSSLPQPAALEQISASGNLVLDANALTAADDAWVRFLAISEQLQNPSLPAAAKASLMNELTLNWRSFRSQSEPIARQLEDYIAKQETAPAGDRRV
jgi:hypothetical protein